MGLFVCMLADIVHSVSVFTMCGMLFAFQRRKFKYGLLTYLFTIIILCVVSVIVHYGNNDVIETLIYMVIMISMVFLLYNESIKKVTIVSIWSIFVVSVIDVMAMVIVKMSIQLLQINLGIIESLIESILSCCVIYILGRIYKKSISESLLAIGMTNLIGFTVLLMVDFFVVSAIVIGTNMYEDNARNIYLIAVIFAVIGIFIQLAAVIVLFAQRNVHKEKEQILDAFLNEQKNHYEYLENREKETKKFRHDIRNHMDLIANLARNREYDKIEDYLEQINLKVDTFGNIVTVHNAIVDAIINQYYMKAMQSGVKLTVEGRFPVDCAIDTYDLCTIFSNILSNAYEAAVETEDKLVSLVCGYTERAIIIVVKNSCNSEATTGGTIWKTKKNNADYHGYGLENISDSVNKYDGIFDIEIMDNVCILKIAFNRMGTSKVETVEAGYENSNCG